MSTMTTGSIRMLSSLHQRLTLSVASRWTVVPLCQPHQHYASCRSFASTKFKSSRRPPSTKQNSQKKHHQKQSKKQQSSFGRKSSFGFQPSKGKARFKGDTQKTPKKAFKLPKNGIDYEPKAFNNFVPPALLIPTASPYAYVARAALTPDLLEDGDEEEDYNPFELARTFFADVMQAEDSSTGGSSHAAPFAGMTFEYFAPKSFGHELPNSGKLVPEVAFLGRSNVGKSSLINSLMKRDLARCSKHPGRTQQPYYYGLVPTDQWSKAQGKQQPTKKGFGNNNNDNSNSSLSSLMSLTQGYLVDLPGYGYANAPDKAVEEWQKDTQDFLCARRDAGSLQRLYMLIDARRGLNVASSRNMALDLGVLHWLDEECIPYSIVITKSDCVGAPQRVKVANEACMRYQQQHQDECEQVMHDGVAEDEIVAAGYMGPIVHLTSATKKQGLEELRSSVEAEFNSVKA